MITKGNNPRGRPYKPGQSGNPHGRPKISADVREARRLNAAAVELIIYKYLNAPLPDLRAVFRNSDTPVQDLIVIRLIISAIEKGDHQSFDFLLNRTIGKVTDKIDHTVELKPTILVKRDGTEMIFKNDSL